MCRRTNRSAGSVGSAQCLLSAGSWLSTGSLLSAQSSWSVLSWKARGGFLAAGALTTVAGAALLLRTASRSHRA
ncbi:hypothetical protein [Streptomyces rubiginosohelvolus]